MAKENYKRMYMHTIRGRPAFYQDGKQICYANTNSLKFPKHLCKSLYELRKQQGLSDDWREKRGFDLTDYSYIIIKISIN